MNTFKNIFYSLTKSKLKSIDNIFNNYNNEKLGEIINIYLTINGFRKTCLTVFNLSKININNFESKFNVKIYKFESKKKKIKGFLVTTLKTNNIKKISEDYEKYVYNTVKYDNKQFSIVQEKMGKILDFINPISPTNNNETNGLFFNIYYNNKFITNGIYEQAINKNLTPKNLQKINKKMLLMNNLLKNISKNINLILEIKLN
jgi:hypothetical protein